MSDKEILASLEAKRTKCVVYTRVMGYHRPVESFNLGKRRAQRARQILRAKNPLKSCE